MNILNFTQISIIQFIVMVVVGMAFNPMNLAYTSDLYISQTLFYGGLLMASNMIWSRNRSFYYDASFRRSTFLYWYWIILYLCLFTSFTVLCE